MPVRQALDIRQRLLAMTDKNTPEYNERNIALGWSYNTLAEINRYRGKLAASQKYYQLSESIFASSGYYEGQAIALQALGDTIRRIALAAEGQGDHEQSLLHWNDSEANLIKSFELYSRYDLSRGLETAYRRYGRLLHSRPEPDYAAAEDNYRRALSLAQKKGNTLEVIESIQELIFLFGEQGRSKEFEKWKKELFKYQDKIWQWKVFPPVVKIAEGCLNFAKKRYEEAVDVYLSGYIELAKIQGYGLALYGMHRDRVFNNLNRIDDVNLKRKLLMKMRETWKEEGLSKKFPGFIKLCESQLLIIDLF